MEKFKKLLDIIDTDWIKENPDTALTLIEALIKDIRNYKNVVEVQSKKLLLTTAIIESMK